MAANGRDDALLPTAKTYDADKSALVHKENSGLNASSLNVMVPSCTPAARLLEGIIM